MHDDGMYCSALVSEHDLWIGLALASVVCASLGHDCSLESDMPRIVACIHDKVSTRWLGVVTVLCHTHEAHAVLLPNAENFCRWSLLKHLRSMCACLQDTTYLPNVSKLRYSQLAEACVIVFFIQALCLCMCRWNSLVVCDRDKVPNPDRIGKVVNSPDGRARC